jgi:hypothetical protein
MTKLTRLLGLAAVAGLVAIAAPTGGAQAATLLGPGLAAAVQDAPSSKLTSEAHWRRGWHHHHHRWHRRHWHRRHWR